MLLSTKIPATENVVKIKITHNLTEIPNKGFFYGVEYPLIDKVEDYSKIKNGANVLMVTTRGYSLFKNLVYTNVNFEIVEVGEENNEI